MVRAVMIVEMAGRPAGHLKDSLARHVGVLDKVDDIDVHSIKISEPRALPQSEEQQVAGHEMMFTCFAEADFECDSFARLSETMFDFMPSSVEVIEPAKVVMTMKEATDLLNNISGRMHRYDEFAKVAGIRMKQMAEALERRKATETGDGGRGVEGRKKRIKKKVGRKKISKKRAGKK